MSGFELKSGARARIRERSPKILITAAIYVVIMLIMSELQYRLPGTNEAFDTYFDRISSGEIPDLADFYSFLRPSGVPFAVILWLLSPVISVGFMSFCLKTSRGSACEHSDIFDGFLCFGKIILLRLVTSVMVFLWSLLFIFPGIVASYRYRQAYYILLDDPEKGVFQCISESKAMMRGHKTDLFLLDLSFIGWNILDSLVSYIIPLPFPLPIVSVWLSPYIGLAHAGFYDRLSKNLYA